MICQNPCDEYTQLRKETVNAIADGISSSDFRKYEKKIENYCKFECPHPNDKAKTLLQKL